MRGVAVRFKSSESGEGSVSFEGNDKRLVRLGYDRDECVGCSGFMAR